MARVLVASRDFLLLLHARGRGGASTEQREGGDTIVTKEEGMKWRTDRGRGEGEGEGEGWPMGWGKGVRWCGSRAQGGNG
jgi:hypothetical protein